MNRRRLRSVLAFTVTFGALLVGGYHRLLAGNLVFSRDTSRFGFPIKAYAVARLRQGHLPLWYPYEALGTPFLGSGVTAVFHPLTWLAVLVGPVWGQALATLACVVLTAVGTFLLARRLGASTSGACVAVTMAVGGGSFVSTLDNQTFLWGVTAFPFFVWGIVGIARHRVPRKDVVVAACAVAWACLAGDFEAAYVFGLVGIGTALLVGRRPRLRALAWVAGAGLLGLALAGAQAVPSLAILRYTDRAAGLPWATAAQWSTHPLRLAEMFLGDLLRYRPLGHGVDVHTLVVGGNRSPWQLTTFVGTLGLLGLVLIPVGHARRRIATAFALLAGGLLWLALGRYGGVYHLAFRLLPVWDAFRYPEKLLPYVQVLLAVVTAVTLTAAWHRPRRAAPVALGLSVLLLLVAPVLGWGGGHATQPLATWLHRARDGALVGAGACAVLGLVWLARQRGSLARAAGVLAAVPVIVSLLQLSPVDGRLLAMMSGPSFLLTAPSVAAAALREHGVRSPGEARLTTYTGTTLGMSFPSPDPDVAEGFAGRALWDRAALAPDHSGLFHIEATTHYLPAVTQRYRREIDRQPIRWLTRDAAIFNGRFAAIDRPTFTREGWPWAPVILDRKDIGLVVVEDAAALPRAFLTAPRFVAGPDQAYSALADRSVARGREAVVEGTAPRGYGGQAALTGPTAATVVSYAPERVVVEALATRPSVLVLNDSFFPGWTATDNGRPTRIRRANYLVRGVLVGKGKHTVVFTYRTPTSLWLGGLASILAACAIIVLGVASARRRGRAPRE